ncbi:hypothetical protein ACFL5N_02845, partial [bacterium]
LNSENLKLLGDIVLFWSNVKASDDAVFEKPKDTKLKYKNVKTTRDMHIVGDTYGDMNVMLGALIQSGIARINAKNPFVFINISTGKRKFSLTKKDFRKEKFIKIPNLDLVMAKDKGIVFLGNVITKGRFTDESFLLLVDLLKRQDKLMKKKKIKADKPLVTYVLGDKELKLLKDNYDEYFKVYLKRKDKEVKNVYILDQFKFALRKKLIKPCYVEDGLFYKRGCLTETFLDKFLEDIKKIKKVQIKNFKEDAERLINKIKKSTTLVPAEDIAKLSKYIHLIFYQNWESSLNRTSFENSLYKEKDFWDLKDMDEYHELIKKSEGAFQEIKNYDAYIKSTKESAKKVIDQVSKVSTVSSGVNSSTDFREYKFESWTSPVINFNVNPSYKVQNSLTNKKTKGFTQGSLVSFGLIKKYTSNVYQITCKKEYKQGFKDGGASQKDSSINKLVRDRELEKRGKIKISKKKRYVKTEPFKKLSENEIDKINMNNYKDSVALKESYKNPNDFIMNRAKMFFPDTLKLIFNADVNNTELGRVSFVPLTFTTFISQMQNHPKVAFIHLDRSLNNILQALKTDLYLEKDKTKKEEIKKTITSLEKALIKDRKKILQISPEMIYVTMLATAVMGLETIQEFFDSSRAAQKKKRFAVNTFLINIIHNIRFLYESGFIGDKELYELALDSEKVLDNNIDNLKKKDINKKEKAAKKITIKALELYQMIRDHKYSEKVPVMRLKKLFEKIESKEFDLKDINSARAGKLAGEMSVLDDYLKGVSVQISPKIKKEKKLKVVPKKVRDLIDKALKNYIKTHEIEGKKTGGQKYSEVLEELTRSEYLKDNISENLAKMDLSVYVKKLSQSEIDGIRVQILSGNLYNYNCAFSSFIMGLIDAFVILFLQILLPYIHPYT